MAIQNRKKGRATHLILKPNSICIGLNTRTVSLYPNVVFRCIFSAEPLDVFLSPTKSICMFLFFICLLRISNSANKGIVLLLFDVKNTMFSEVELVIFD